MKKATISQTKNNLSALLDQVRNGETILVMDRNRPIARIEPIASGGSVDPSGRLARLERAGLLRRGRRPTGRDPLLDPPPKPRAGADILEVLLEERREGR